VPYDVDHLGKVIRKDILVLGSGAAGCGAAMAAKARGADVLMLDKGKLESSGCLGGGNDHFMAVLGSGSKTDTREALIDFYHGPISGYTPAMISQWYDAMQPMIDLLLEIGVEFEKNADGSWLRTVGFGQPDAWFINIANGQLIKRRLARKIRDLGIEVLDHVMVTRLLVNGGRVIGAVGYRVTDGEFFIFLAKAVIIALGNSANRASSNATGNAYNTWHSPYNTGSHFVLSYEAGARVINLDLKQQATLIPKSFGSAGMNGINSVGAHELNALGERFMGKYHPMMENGPRRNQIVGTYQELIEGKGPPFVMDMRHCDKDELHHLQYVLMPGDKATFLDYAEQAGIDFAKYPMEVELSEIELSGMLMTGEDFESTVAGLYNGCVFYNFSGSLCSGHIAGTHAAQSLSGRRLPEAVDAHEIAAEKKRILKPLADPGDLKPDYVEGVIRQVMKYYMGFVRNEKGMQAALDKLRFVEGYLPELCAANYHELMKANEAAHLLKICQLAVAATMQRRESGRALYQRSDYPDLDDRYAKMLALWQSGGEMQHEWL